VPNFLDPNGQEVLLIQAGNIEASELTCVLRLDGEASGQQAYIDYQPVVNRLICVHQTGPPPNDGVGPCVNARAAIIDRARANVAIDIHADGGPPDGRGFAILEPVADGINNRIIGASQRLGHILRACYLAVTGLPESTYDGVGGIEPRDNLAGLNLTTVPEVLIEGGNLRNATDATLLVTSAFQHRAAEAMAEAITEFLTGHV
jgi:N-acetylmuramoyl-L-alanine amidase